LKKYIAKKISVAMHKGGTGKTTTCISLGHGLALKGKKVLVVDCDPQGNAGTWLGIKNQITLYHLLNDESSLKDCIVNARENLDIIISNKTLSVAEQQLVGKMGREKVLKRKLAGIENEYDFVLLDLAPSWRLLNQNALIYSDGVFIPISMEYFALLGARQIVDELSMIREYLDHELNVSLVIPTFFDIRNKKSKEVIEGLTDYFGKEKVADPIRVNCSLSEAPSYNQTIFEYSPKSHGALDYQKLTERVLKI
jgi:chromosome partitioning protein